MGNKENEKGHETREFIEESMQNELSKSLPSPCPRAPWIVTEQGLYMHIGSPRSGHAALPALRGDEVAFHLSTAPLAISGPPLPCAALPKDPSQPTQS